MSNKSLAKTLQRLAEDELGVRPKLQGCHNIVNQHEGVLTGTKEEKAAQLFFAYRERLLASAERGR